MRPSGLDNSLLSAGDGFLRRFSTCL